MKKMLKTVLTVSMIAGLAGCGSSSGEYEGQTLRLYNWGEYIGENVIHDFEEKTGAKVVNDFFDSNEQMYVKVSNGEKYDILVPSDYMIQRLIEEDFLTKLDHDKLTCMDAINPDILDLEYDPGNTYSIPYFWGTVGIVYDTTQVDKKDLENEGWDIFLDTKYKDNIYLYNSERDSFMMALKSLGYSMNTENETELQEAYQWLEQCVTTMNPEIVTDEIIDNMTQGRKAFGLMYSGDATYAMSENEDIDYYMPESGTNIWTDAMVIPKNAENPELAYEFINFISEYDQAYDNSSYVGYTSPITDVAKDLSESDFEGIDAYTPSLSNDKNEVFRYNESTRKTIANLWAKILVVTSNSK